MNVLLISAVTLTLAAAAAPPAAAQSASGGFIDAAPRSGAGYMSVGAGLTPSVVDEVQETVPAAEVATITEPDAAPISHAASVTALAAPAGDAENVSVRDVEVHPIEMRAADVGEVEPAEVDVREMAAREVEVPTVDVRDVGTREADVRHAEVPEVDVRERSEKPATTPRARPKTVAKTRRTKIARQKFRRTIASTAASSDNGPLPRLLARTLDRTDLNIADVGARPRLRSGE